MAVSTWERFGAPASAAPDLQQKPEGKNLWQKVRDMGSGIGNWIDSQAAQQILSTSNPPLYRSYVRRMETGQSIPASEMFKQVRKAFDPDYSESSLRDKLIATGLTALEPVAGWAGGTLGGAAGGAVGSGPGAVAGATAGRIAGPALIRTMANMANPEAAGRNVLWDVGAVAGGKALGTLASTRYRQALQPMLARKYPRAERVLSQVEKALDPLTGPAATNAGLPRSINSRLQRMGPQGFHKDMLPVPVPRPPTGRGMPMTPPQKPVARIPYPLEGAPTGQMNLGVPGVATQQSMGLPRMRQFQPQTIQGPAARPGIQGDLGLQPPPHQMAMPGIGNPKIIPAGKASVFKKVNIRKVLEDIPPEEEALPMLDEFILKSTVQHPPKIKESIKNFGVGNLTRSTFETNPNLKVPPRPPEPPVAPPTLKPPEPPVTPREPYQFEKLATEMQKIFNPKASPPAVSKITPPKGDGPDLWTDYFKRNPMPTQPKVKPKAKPKPLKVKNSLAAKTTPLRGFRGTTAGDVLKKRYRKNEQLGFGYHFTTDKKLAQRYATDPTVARPGKLPYVHEAELGLKNPVDARKIVGAGDAEWPLVQKLMNKKNPGYPNNGRNEVYLENAINATTPQRAEKILKEFGHDGVIYNAQVKKPAVGGSYNDRPATSYVVFDEKQAKIIKAMQQTKKVTSKPKPVPIKEAVKKLKPAPVTAKKPVMVKRGPGKKQPERYYETEGGLRTTRDPLNQKKKGVLGRFNRVEYETKRGKEPRLLDPEDVIRFQMENFIPNQVGRVTAKSISYIDGRRIPFKFASGARKGVLRNQFMKDHADKLTKAMREGYDVNARAVDFYGPRNVKVPEGYIRKGNLYVRNQGKSVGAYNPNYDEGGVSIDAPQPYKGSIKKVNMSAAEYDAHYAIRSDLKRSWESMDRLIRGGHSTSYAGNLWRIFRQVVHDINPPHFTDDGIDLTINQLRSLRPLAEGSHWKAFWAEADRLLTLEARKRM